MSDAEDTLLPEFERELALLRRSLGEFAQRYPRAAARLAIAGEHSEDPYVERLIQSGALLNARVAARLGDDYPDLPKTLLKILHPECLKPLPSCSIAYFEGNEAMASSTKPVIVERGTELRTRTGDYPFRTVYDVLFAPLQLADVRYTSVASSPGNVRLHEDTTGIVSIGIQALTTNALRDPHMPKHLRLFIDGDPATAAATQDALLLRATSALVEADENGTWIALNTVPLSAAGLDLDEALIDRHDGMQSRFRPVLESLAFPAKFNFVDLDLSALIRVAGPCRRMTLHLPIANLHPDSAPAQRLQRLTVSNLKLRCTPVVNVFSSRADPIALADTELEAFPLAPATLNASDTRIYRVDGVRLTEEMSTGPVVSDIAPYHAFSHAGSVRIPAVYWLAENDNRFPSRSSSGVTTISFVDPSGRTADVPGTQVDADLTCTNGTLPASLRIGDTQGDLIHENETSTGRISMLCVPTESVEPPSGHRHPWTIVAMLPSNSLCLSQAGLPALKRLLEAFAPSRCASASRQIASLKYLAGETALEWMPMDPQPMLVRGMRVRLAIDETLLDDRAISTFGRVLEPIFLHYAPASSFVQLVLISAQNGAEIMRGQPLPGAAPLL